ncbi:MAG: alpha/beta fold hydrolase [Oryzomicrobium sp.]|nr:alpha/beta fold hydrolase [Oryzomicrobium sp.]MCE1241792.1 alpha/beta fold hydrolase [Oryzomicrobium sp.]
MMASAKSPTHRHCTVDLQGLSPLEALGEKFAQQVDPFGIATSLANAQIAWWLHPQEMARVAMGLSGDALALQAHILRRAWGLPSEDVVTPDPGDARFSDPVWAEAPTWDILKETYLAITHRLQDMYFETPGQSDKERRRAAFWLRKWLNAMAPTNFFWTNPVAMRKFAASHGDSLAQGCRNFLADLRAGNIRMVDEDAFTVGKDLATTAGQVVFRNRLVEVIQYSPRTDQVRAMPLVIFPPWINKFYILDLNAKKSLVKYLVDQGFTVFLASWKNPTPDMADVTFDNYLEEGYQKVIEAATAIAKVPQVHAVGYCIGGTGLTAYLAWANRRYGDPAKVPVAHWSTFTTLTDFAHPGDIEVFLDEGAVEWLEKKMSQQGYLDGKDMASSFRMLRSNSLIWHYWVHSYLYGEPLPPFDVLFWNSDTTRMPMAMHSYYLREMYLKNNLVKKDAITLAGESIDMECIVQPLFAVTAEDDHIAPWKQCFHIRRHIPAPMRFVLSTSGHILGIINPPVDPPKRAYWMADASRGEGSDSWKERAPRHAGSWWPAWIEWLDERCGEQVAPPKSHRSYPALEKAPGTYVLEH